MIPGPNDMLTRHGVGTPVLTLPVAPDGCTYAQFYCRKLGRQGRRHWFAKCPGRAEWVELAQAACLHPSEMQRVYESMQLEVRFSADAAMFWHRDHPERRYATNLGTLKESPCHGTFSRYVSDDGPPVDICACGEVLPHPIKPMPQAKATA